MNICQFGIGVYNFLSFHHSVHLFLSLNIDTFMMMCWTSPYCKHIRLLVLVTLGNSLFAWLLLPWFSSAFHSWQSTQCFLHFIDILTILYTTVILHSPYMHFDLLFTGSCVISQPIVLFLPLSTHRSTWIFLMYQSSFSTFHSCCVLHT